MMANTEIAKRANGDASKWLWPIVAVGGIGLAGYFIYRVLSRPPIPPAVQELIDEWLLEAEEATQIHRDACEAGELTDQQRALLEQLEAEMKVKELWVYIFGQTWVEKLGDEAEAFFKTVGMWVIIPSVAGGILISGFVFLIKHWPMFRRVPPPPHSGGPYGGNFPPKHDPPPPPPQICPKCGLEFPTPEALKSHVIATHKITDDPNIIRAAQQAFNEASVLERDLVAVQSGIPDVSTAPWELLTAIALLTIVASIGIVLSFGLPAGAAGVAGTAAFRVSGNMATARAVDAWLRAMQMVPV